MGGGTPLVNIRYDDLAFVGVALSLKDFTSLHSLASKAFTAPPPLQAPLGTHRPTPFPRFHCFLLPDAAPCTPSPLS